MFIFLVFVIKGLVNGGGVGVGEVLVGLRKFFEEGVLDFLRRRGFVRFRGDLLREYYVVFCLYFVGFFV